MANPQTCKKRLRVAFRGLTQQAGPGSPALNTLHATRGILAISARQWHHNDLQARLWQMTGEGPLQSPFESTVDARHPPEADDVAKPTEMSSDDSSGDDTAKDEPAHTDPAEDTETVWQSPMFRRAPFIIGEPHKYVGGVPPAKSRPISTGTALPPACTATGLPLLDPTLQEIPLCSDVTRFVLPLSCSARVLRAPGGECPRAGFFCSCQRRLRPNLHQQQSGSACAMCCPVAEPVQRV